MNRFGLAAIAQTRDNRLLITRDPAGHSQAFWGRAVDLGPVLDRARADSGDVVKAAAKLRIKLVEHSAALQRTEEIVRRLDARLHAAQAGGDLKAFNKAYKRYRLDLTAAGRAPMTYTVARSRLRQALADTAAGRAPGPGIVRRIFES
jgi:hypothetical protein